MHRATMAATTLRLLDTAPSPFAQKVRIALREKGIPFESVVPAGMGSGRASQELDTHSLRKEVPALIVTSSSSKPVSIIDSKVILEYIEDAFPENPLRPLDPLQKAAARELDLVMESVYEPINWARAEMVYARRVPDAALEKQLMAKNDADQKSIQQWLQTKLADKNYFNGDGSAFGYADIAVAPYISRSVIYGQGPAPGSPLANWFSRIQKRPSVQETFKEAEGALDGFFKALGNFTAHHSDKLKEDRPRRLYRDHRLEWFVKNGAIDIVKEGIEEDNVRFSAGPVTGRLET